MSKNNFKKKILLIPASGIGSRMELDIPKQYLKLSNNKTILDTTISNLLKNDFFDLVVVALHKNDCYWQNSIHSKNPRILTTIGGETRFISVYNALKKTFNLIDDNDWVFVHDAARPCIDIADVNNLFSNVTKSKAQSGILATKAFETVKEAKISDNNDNITVKKTLDRNHIWLAQTPQLATKKTFVNAFHYCINKKLDNFVTDESSALEIYGISPLIIEGNRTNIKVTTQQDLFFVDYYLQQSN